MTESVLLSVVVACYNVADYLKDCLNSIEDQTYHNLEVLLIDDCSTDDGRTAAIVDEYAQKNKMFTAIHNEQNLGISSTRNKGINLAQGKYITFVDGDDILPVDAYYNFILSVERSGSLVATGFVRRFDKFRDKPSYLHRLAISDDYQRTTLKDHPELIYDTTCWNKIYNLKFLKDNNIYFPVGMIYEDVSFTLKAFTSASTQGSIDILTNIVYRWRWRDASVSFTQGKNNINSFEDRIKSIYQARTILTDASLWQDENISNMLKLKVIQVDFRLFMDEFADSTENFQLDFQRLAYLFLRDWNMLKSPLFEQLPLKVQSQYKALLDGNLKKLREYSYLPYQDSFRVKMNRLLTGKKVADDLNFVTKVVDINLENEYVTIKGEAGISSKIHRLWLSKTNLNEKVEVDILNIETNGTMSLNEFERPRAWGNLHLKRQIAPYSRFILRFNLNEVVKKLGQGTYKIQVKLSYGKYSVQGFIGQPRRGTHRMTTFSNEKGVLVSQTYNQLWDLVFKAHKALNTKTERVNNSNELLKFETTSEDLLITFQTTTKHVVLQFNDLLIFPEEKITERNIVFRINHEQLKKNIGNMHKIALLDVHSNLEVEYSAADKSQLEIKHLANIDVLISFRSTTNVWIMPEVPLVIVNKVFVESNDSKNAILKLQTDLPNAYQDLKDWQNGTVELISGNREKRYLSLGKVVLNDSKLNATVVILQDNQLNVLSGNYRVYINGTVDGQRIRFKVMDLKDKAKEKIEKSGAFTFTLSKTVNQYFTFKVVQRRAWIDRTKLRRGITFSVLYPMMRMLPLKKKTIVFESFWGSFFNDSPKAMYEYLLKTHPDFKFVWFFVNDQTPIHGPAVRVRRFSFKYWYYMATAKFLIQNTNFPNQYSKRAGQIEVETLHGTFMKVMGFDEPHFKNGSAKIQKNFTKRNNRWDLMSVPSDYMARTATRAFDYPHELVRSGFPRNDTLFTNNNVNYKEKIKSSLGISLDKKVILYAPTYRDGNDSFDFELDLEKMQQTIGDDYVVLVRLHYFVAHAHSFLDQVGFVYDVSDYPDINDLYLISDALITDYSSVMFDYGYLKKPMIFFAYDKDWYLNPQNRGVYLNYEDTVPGPILKTTDEIIETLKNWNDLVGTYRKNLDKFYDKFCQYGRGNATRELTEKMLTLRPVKQDSIVKHLFANKILRLLKLRDFQSRLLNFLGRYLPKKNIVMFESFFGRQYSDNPKAIYEYLKENHPELKLYWNVNSDYVDYFKKNHIPYIKRFSYRGLLKQAQAKYWVTNVRRPFRWRKPIGTKVIQTWHGTPLKTIGTDVNTVTMPGVNRQKYHRQVIRDAARWDYLIAPNTYSYDIMQRAFRKSYNQMISSGYPRNDQLKNYSNDEVISIKKKLNLESCKKVVLYAPTWRDNDFVRADEFRADLKLDLRKVLDATNNDTVILIRTHYLIANNLDLTTFGNRVRNVSDYEDIMELYLISDVLITDYSSVMFDFANLNRPILFFAYDLEEYANTIRGFYLNYKEMTPGPIVQTNDELIPILKNMLKDPTKYTKTSSYRNFLNEFTSWEDGYSTKRLVDYVFKDHHYDINLNEVPAEIIAIRDGAQFWSAVPGVKDAHIMTNYDRRGKDNFKKVAMARLQDPIRKREIGNKYARVRSTTKGKTFDYWVREDDILDVD